MGDWISRYVGVLLTLVCGTLLLFIYSQGGGGTGIVAENQIFSSGNSRAFDKSHLVIIDGTVDDDELLQTEIVRHYSYPSYILTETKEGLADIERLAASSQNLKSIHLISHGAAGQIQLGKKHYKLGDLVAARELLSRIGNSLAPDGEILLYGCDVGQGTEGKTFVDELAKLTGRKVAASVDLTGDDGITGNWNLERSTGTIHSTVLHISEFKHVLWTSDAPIGGWFGDSPPLTPNFTVDPAGAGRFSTVGANLGGGGGTFDIFSTGAASTQRLQNVTATSLATAQAGNFYFYSNLVPAVGQRISAMSFNQVTNNQSTANAAITLYDTVTSTSYTLNSAFLIDGTSTSVSIPLSGVPGMVPGRTYQLRFYMWNCSSTCYIDNPRFSSQLNEAPSAFNDAVATPFQTSYSGNLFSNNGSGADSDPELQALTISQINSASFTVGTPVALTNGSVTIINAGTGQFQFIPSTGYTGTQSFTYTISDGFGGTSTATATVTIGPSIVITLVTQGGTATVSFTGTNGFSPTSVTTTSPGLPASSPATAVAVASTATTLAESIPSGYMLTAISCSGLGAGTATPNLGTASIALDAPAMSPGNSISCTFTNVKIVPQLTIVKSASTSTAVSVGQTITYTFEVTNSGNVPILDVFVTDTHNGYGVPPSPQGEQLKTDVAPLGDSTDSSSNGTWEVLGPGDTIKFTGSYTVLQADIDNLQ